MDIHSIYLHQWSGEPRIHQNIQENKTINIKKILIENMKKKMVRFQAGINFGQKHQTRSKILCF